MNMSLNHTPTANAPVDPEPAAVIAELLEVATERRGKAGEVLQLAQAEFDKHDRSVRAFTAAKRAIDVSWRNATPRDAANDAMSVH